MTPRTRLVGVGAAWALAVALPADLLAQIADAATRGDGHSPVAYPCVALILVGMGIGGGAVGAAAHRLDQLPRPVVWLSAAAGLTAMAIILLIGVTRSLAAGHHVDWGAVPVLLALGAFLGGVGGVVGRARGRTSRP